MYQVQKMIQFQPDMKLECQEYDHKDEIETICFNSFCSEFRLNYFICIKKGRSHLDHLDDVEKINSLMGFWMRKKKKNIEFDNLIDDPNTFVESLNQSFSLLKRGIRQKSSLQKERIINLNSKQIYDYLNSTLKLIEYKQSITTIISDQTMKLTDKFDNLYQQLQLSSFNYQQIDDRLYSKELYNQDKITEAIDILDPSIQQNPNNLYGAKMKIVDNQQEHEAISQLDKALAIDPKHINSLGEKGGCLRILKKYNESLQVLDQALSINPKNTFSLQSKGGCVQCIKNHFILRDQQQYKWLQFIMRNHQPLIRMINIQQIKRNFAKRNQINECYYNQKQSLEYFSYEIFIIMELNQSQQQQQLLQ
ncbi:unnamed protein product [Paramecium octaurelia]|uniref:Tetratricopeptide repeat protein n=1 Tax=Paramecium octaurelia TaxID=43137 RepID=A0A8S1YL32_PAROT|nr:unnamed protein product [Paramecium octaurelia]